MASLEGFGKGRIEPMYPGVDDNIPLLSSFYFRFERENPSGPVDNHINAIRVLPAGEAEDVSPDAGIPPVTIESGKISLIYQDKDADSAKDRYFFKVAHSVEPITARRFQIRDVGCRHICERVLPPPDGPGGHVFVLVGFQLFYTGGRDHHADQFGIKEENGKLTVSLNDACGGIGEPPVFGYIIDYALVNPVAHDIQLGEEAGEAKGGARVTLPEGKKVIRGFFFDYPFPQGDHELREIGVLTSDENLDVFYGDKNGDDRFAWRVRWATIKPLIIDPA